MNTSIEKISFVKCPFMYDSAYRKNLVLYNFLLMEDIPKEGFLTPYLTNAQKFNFSFWLGYLSCLQNPDLEKNVTFEDWLRYVKKIIKLMGDACDYSLSDSEKILYSYALAIRVYPNADKHLLNTRAVSSDKLEKILNIDAVKDEQKWAIYIVSNTILCVLEKEERLRSHLFFAFMKKVTELMDEFSTLEEKFDNYRVGKGLYE